MGNFLCRINPLTPPSYKINQDNLSAWYEDRKGIPTSYFNRQCWLATRADTAFNKYPKHCKPEETFIIFTLIVQLG